MQIISFTPFWKNIPKLNYIESTQCCSVSQLDCTFKMVEIYF